MIIQQSMDSGSAEVQILLAACQRFAMVRISDNGPGWEKDFSCLSLVNHSLKVKTTLPSPSSQYKSSVIRQKDESQN